MRRTTQLLAALHEETLVVATADHVYLTDLNLHIHADLKDSFEPIRMSLDETGRIYLVVRVKGQPALWLLTSKGERQLSVPLPVDLQYLLTPPVIGYDHRVFLCAPNHLVAIGPDGRRAWEQTPKQAMGGISATADDQLLVADGRELAVFDATGNR